MNLGELAVRSAELHPERTAISHLLGSLTYAQLDSQANATAAVLADLGVTPGSRVIIWTEKSPLAIVTMQALLRLGAAYVPVDSNTPARRLAAIAIDCEAKVICTTTDHIPLVSELLGADTGFLDLTTLPAHLANQSGSIPSAFPGLPYYETSANDLAYILYTSGSTGAPKGVCISHRNALAFTQWAASELGARATDRFSNHASFTFDLSVLDLYAAFSVGASVHILSSHLAYAPDQLVEYIYKEEISIWYSVPSAISLMINSGRLVDGSPPPALRAILFAGEPFPIIGVRSLAQWSDARLLNLYGPTETNVCTFHEVTEEDLTRDKPPPIGRACCGNKVWAQASSGRPALPGEDGELLVDGPTVMLGYWGSHPQIGPYRTGDIVRVLSDGTFDYLGRMDHMVKIRGHRVEILEVEAAIAGHPSVAEVAVDVHGTGLEAELEAFVVPKPGLSPSLLNLKQYVAERLPRYMIIDRAYMVSHLPRNSNGKLDRAAIASIRPITGGPA